MVQPPVFVTAAQKKKKNLLSPGHVAVRRSRRYKIQPNTKFAKLCVAQLLALHREVSTIGQPGELAYPGKLQRRDNRVVEGFVAGLVKTLNCFIEALVEA